MIADDSRGVEKMNKKFDNNESQNGFGFTPIGKLREVRVKWLIDLILIKGALVFISGPPKAGKSTLLLHLIICLTKGLMFLNHFMTKKAKCLLYTLEDHKGETKAKAKYMLNGKRFPRSFLVSDTNGLNLPDDFDRIEDDIKESKASVVCIDTLRRSHNCNEDSSTDMAPIMKGARGLIRKYKVTIIFVHHTGHEINNPKKSGNWLRGTSDMDGSFEVLIGVMKSIERTRLYVFHKYRADFNGTYKLLIGNIVDKLTGDHPIIDLVYEDPNTERNKGDDGIVLSALEQGSASANELERKLKDSLSRPRIDGALARLKNKGKIKKVGKGKGTKWEVIRKNTSIP